MPLSLRDTAKKLGPRDPALAGTAGPAESGRNLARRIRWQKGWQGTGRLSGKALARTMAVSNLRDALRKIDGSAPPPSIRDAYARLGYPLGGGVTGVPPGPVSMAQVASRVVGTAVRPIKLLSYNTYLLPGLELPIRKWIDQGGWGSLGTFGVPFNGALLDLLGIEIPGAALALGALKALLEEAGWTPSRVIEEVLGVQLTVRIASKPALDQRASALGPVIADYDLCCLSEVWTEDSAARILAGLQAVHNEPWTSVLGPGDHGDFVFLGSGLDFAAKRFPVTRTDRLIYADRGDRRHDADAWSNKGAMFNAIDVGVGELELLQTHLCYGGGIPLKVDGFRNPTDSERLAVWHSELDQLTDFFRSNHRKTNVAIITGDFNMDGVNVGQYAELRQRMDKLGLQDAWAWDAHDHLPSEGQTCRYTDDDKSGWDRTFDAVCDSLNAGPRGRDYCADNRYKARPKQGVGRFDYLWVTRPTPEHRYRLELSRILRRPFSWGREVDGETYLSDHLGLDVVLLVSPQ
jgi:hypothetical protein